MNGSDLLDNAKITELLSREAEQATDQLDQAFRRAARKAFLWEPETYDLLAAGKPLIELKELAPICPGGSKNGLKAPSPPFATCDSGGASLSLAQDGCLLTIQISLERYNRNSMLILAGVTAPVPWRKWQLRPRSRLQIFGDHRSY